MLRKNKTISHILHRPGHSNLQTIGAPKIAKAMRQCSEGYRKKRKRKPNNENSKKVLKANRFSNFDAA